MGEASVIIVNINEQISTRLHLLQISLYNHPCLKWIQGEKEVTLQLSVKWIRLPLTKWHSEIGELRVLVAAKPRSCASVAPGLTQSRKNDVLSFFFIWKISPFRIDFHLPLYIHVYIYITIILIEANGSLSGAKESQNKFSQNSHGCAAKVKARLSQSK